MTTSTNANRPRGFVPNGYIGGAKWTGEVSLYAFSASDATGAAYKGDVVQFDSTNRTLALTDIYRPALPLVKPVVAGVTTTAIRGVIAGFLAQPEFSNSATASLGTMYRATSTKAYVLIADNPLVTFEVQEDGNSYTSASSNAVNKTADVAYTAGNTSTGVSGAQLDSSDVQTAAARPFRVLRYNPRVDNFGFASTDTLSYAKFDVVIANSDLVQATATQYGA